MAEPDDLYTLRAQFWLGHYDMVRFVMSLKRWYPRTEVEEGAKHACCCFVVPILFQCVMCSFCARHVLVLELGLGGRR